MDVNIKKGDLQFKGNRKDFGSFLKKTGINVSEVVKPPDKKIGLIWAIVSFVVFFAMVSIIYSNLLQNTRANQIISICTFFPTLAIFLILHINYKNHFITITTLTMLIIIMMVAMGVIPMSEALNKMNNNLPKPDV